MRERNKCQHGGQRGQDNGARPLDGGLDDRVIGIKAICLIGMNLTEPVSSRAGVSPDSFKTLHAWAGTQILTVPILISRLWQP